MCRPSILSFELEIETGKVHMDGKLEDLYQFHVMLIARTRCHKAQRSPCMSAFRSRRKAQELGLHVPIVHSMIGKLARALRGVVSKPSADDPIAHAKATRPHTSPSSTARRESPP